MANINEYGYQNGNTLLENGNVTNVANRYANKTVGFEQLTVGTAAVKLTAATYANAVKAIITIEGGAVRLRTDGTNPTSSIGLCKEEGGSIELESISELTNFAVISATGTNVVLNVEYKG